MKRERHVEVLAGSGKSAAIVQAKSLKTGLQPVDKRPSSFKYPVRSGSAWQGPKLTAASDAESLPRHHNRARLQLNLTVTSLNIDNDYFRLSK